MKSLVRRSTAILCALFLIVTNSACQQKEPKMKDGKILLTVCMESSVGLPNVGKGTTMENSIQSIAQYYTANVNPDVTFEFVTLTADQEERSNRIDQLQAEMMAGQGPDIFILPCDDGFTYNETQLIENVEKGMATGPFADLTTLYNQDETLEKDVLLEKVMDAGVMDDKRYILPLRYQYPIILALEDELQAAELELSELSQNAETFLSTVLSQEKNAWHVSGANVFAANLINVFPSLCDYSTGEVSLDEETVVATLSQYMELLSSLDQKSIEADGGVWPNFLSADRPLSTLFLSDDLFFYLDIAYAQYQDLVAVPFAAQDGSIVANVSYYGAVSANCAAVEEAYEFLKLFLSREVQSGGALEADGASYDASEWGTTHGWPVRSDITAAELRAAVPQTPLLHGMVEELRQPVEGEPAPMLPEEFFTEAYERIGEVRPYTQLDGSFSRAAMSLYDFTTYTPKTGEVENVAQDLLSQLEAEVAE